MPFPAPNWFVSRRPPAACGLAGIIGYGPVLSGADLFRHVWPDLDPGETHPWRWKMVRAVAAAAEVAAAAGSGEFAASASRLIQSD